MSTSFKSASNRNTTNGQANGGREASAGQAQCGQCDQCEGRQAVEAVNAPTPEQVREACRRMSRPTRFEVDLLNDWCKP